MAGLVSISRGRDPAYYTQVSKGPEYYSAGAGIEGLEPAGVWTGGGCPDLGLQVGAEIDKWVFLKLFGDLADPRDGSHLGRALPRYEGWRPVYEEYLAAEPEATAERRKELENQAKAAVPHAVRYFDATLNPSKDITLLHASFMAAKARAQKEGQAGEAARYAELADTVWAAVMEGNQAMLDHFQEHAGYTRSGSHARKVGGETTGRWEDAHAFIVASFRQHTSRNGDPQMHVHNTILNRVRRERDGTHRTLDSRALYRQRGAASAVGTLAMENALARSLGVEFVARKDGHGREIRGIGQGLVDAFSTRTRQDIEGRLPELIEAYRRQFGREPDARALYGLRHRATLDTRPAKESALSLDGHVSRWAQRAREADGEALEPIGAQVCKLGREPVPEPEPGQPLSQDAEHRLMLMALARVNQAQSTWTRSQLTRALGELLPASAGLMGREEARAYLRGLASRAIAGEVGTVALLLPPEFPEVPASLRRANGESMFRPHDATRYATGAQLDMEARILSTAGCAEAAIPSLSREAAAQLLGSDPEALEAQLGHGVPPDVETITGSRLRLDQAAAAFKILTSSRRAECLIGPAGTGKTTVAATMADLWLRSHPGSRVIGLTTSQQARHVLSAAGITDSFNIAKWLKSPDRQEVPPGSLLILDESSMISMTHLDVILRKAREANAKVVCIGDPMQLGAVEQGGGFALLTRHLGAVQLAEPTRFRESWQREASLRLRAGDATVVTEYDNQGRLVYGSRNDMIDRAYKAWLSDYLEGKHSALIAHDQADADEISRRARGDLKYLGRVSKGDTVRLRDGAVASVGDRIMGRKNNRRISVMHGRAIANRDVFHVTGIGAIGITARLFLGRDGGADQWAELCTIPLEYLADECQLAYAITAHSAEGLTYDDNSYSLVRPGDTREYAYTAMTRARGRNVAYVVGEPVRLETDGYDPDPEIARWRDLQAERAGVGEEPRPDEIEGSAVAVLTEVIGNSEHEMSARETREQAYSNEDHLGRLGSRWAEFVQQESVARFSQVVRDVLPEGMAEQALNDPASTWLFRSLREAELAGLDGARLLAEVVAEHHLEGIRDPARVLDARVRARLRDAEPVPLASYADRAGVLADPAQTAYWHEVGKAIDGRIKRLGQYMAETAPLWATRALGPVPKDPEKRARWAERASVVANFRDWWGYENPGDAIGPEPSRRTPEARADWRQALAVMGPIDGIDLRHLDDGTLLLRREAYERETARAPEYVADKLRLMRLAEAEAHAKAIRAEVMATADPHARDRHLQLAGIWRGMEAKAAEEAKAFEAADATRQAWAEMAEPTLRIGMAADAELRKRHPDMKLPALTSAEPSSAFEDEEPTAETLGLTPETVADPIPEIVREVGEACRRKQDEIDQIRSMPEPSEDDEEVSPGEAWRRIIGREREDVWQPSREPMPAAPEIADREAER